ncbi:unnamed protein product [Cercospora beticola]|nr:unnamed protein product [Cercospora beticola]
MKFIHTIIFLLAALAQSAPIINNPINLDDSSSQNLAPRQQKDQNISNGAMGELPVPCNKKMGSAGNCKGAGGNTGRPYNRGCSKFEHCRGH